MYESRDRLRCAVPGLSGTQGPRPRHGPWWQGKGRSVSEGYHLSRRLFVRLSAGAVAATALPIPKALGSERGAAPAIRSRRLRASRASCPRPRMCSGFPIGVDRETTADEINTYLDAVGGGQQPGARADARQSVRGRPIRYALVGDPANVTNQGLAQIQADTATIRDPATPQTTVDALASHHAGDPVDRGEPARRRGERRRCLAPAAVRARRPRRLRGDRHPGTRPDRDHPDAEPRRP